ncbi:MAG: phage holin family protein [Pseudomonadota bacterium]
MASASPLDAVRRLSAATANLLLSRAEFASLELAQARAQLLRWFTLSLLVMVLLLLTLIIGSALLTVALWPQLGWVTLAILFVVYALGAALVLRKLMGEVAAAPPVLSQTLQELSNDRDVFVARARQSMQDNDAEAR